MLSNTSKYAIRAIIYLALNGKDQSKIGIKQISKDLNIPTPFLGPYEISLMDVVEVIDGLDSFNECILGLESCSKDSAHCPIHKNYADIRSQLKNLFDTENIGELADRIKESSDNSIVL